MTESKSETKGPSKEAKCLAVAEIHYLKCADAECEFAPCVDRRCKALDARDVPSEEELKALARTWCKRYASQMPGMFDIIEGMACYVAGYRACLERMKSGK